jgi:hypothetical protein
LRARLKACSVSDEWTEQKAAEWWQERERRSAPIGSVAGSRTISLDIADHVARPLTIAG